MASDGPDVEARLRAVEARLEIGQLPIRYAMAVDGRDLDGWVGLFVPDVDLGPNGQGRDALRDVITPQIRLFYRSIHSICGHRIELLDDDHARGAVYCRAEHEVDNRWIVMAICYFDKYRRVPRDSGGTEWLFERRAERHWYAADVNERPQAVAFDSWHVSPGSPTLPGEFDTWSAFWNGVDAPTAHPATNRRR